MRSQFENEIDIEIIDESPPEFNISQTILEDLQRAAQKTLDFEEVAGPTSLSILLTGDGHIQALNKQYLGQDGITDVLSFPAGESPEMEGLMGPLSAYLGDVAISVPQANRQAAAAGHQLESELQLLTVHAVLHLLGRDHADSKEKEAMWTAQAKILTRLGAEITTPTD